MEFNSMAFLWIFMPVSIILYYLIKEKYRNYLLVALSLIFYAWGDVKSVPLLLLSILINYIIAILMNKAKTIKKRKLAFIISILFNIGILVFFKYSNFIILNINKLLKTRINFKINSIPLSISFYTFSAISYMFDCYRKDAKIQKNIIKFALYILFFPKLLMGPIEKYSDFEKQIDSRIENKEKFVDGIKRFAYGLSKKVLIADTVAIIADQTFKVSNYQNLTSPVAWLGAICYMLQIYFDFSGYSDMAIGLSKMFGFDIKENFDLPYTSQSITEFWRRWHISLGTWFKNYIYIPLGGNRKGKIRTYFNLIIVFIVTGIWHGASWNFLIWGAYNALLVVIEKFKLLELMKKNKIKLINCIYTDFAVLIGWVLFRANGFKNGIKYLKIMFTGNVLQNNIYPLQLYTLLKNRTIATIVIGILFCGILQIIFNKLKNASEIKKKYETYCEPFVICILFIISIMTVVNGTYNSFVYAQF